MITQTMMGCKRLINQVLSPTALSFVALRVSQPRMLSCIFIDILGDEILVSVLIHIHLKGIVTNPSVQFSTMLIPKN